MWIICALLISLPVWALEPYEQISNVKILKVLPDNVVLLSRGLEDGISRNDHIKLTGEGQVFTSRAICLKAGMESSYWKIYRVPYNEAFSGDLSYTIVGLADKEIPARMARLKDKRIDFAEDKKETVASGPNPFEVKRDLPERLTERDLLESTGPEKRKLFLEQAINRDQIQRDLKDYRLSFYASPFTKQSINEGESLRYGVRGGNMASRYRLLTQFEQQQTKLKDPITKDSVSTRSTSGQAQFVVHHLTPNLSSLSLINYNSYRFSQLATPKSHWQLGVLGFTWHLFESKTWEYFDLSYIPLYDLRKTEVFNNDLSVTDIERTGLRHGLRLAVRTKINEKVSFENTFWAKPYQNFTSWKVDATDLNLTNDMKLIFSLTDKLFFDYNLIYQKDKLWAELSDLPESNTINSVNVRYDFDL